MSPLRWFRRHATWMLIIFGVVLMAIFGLGPVFDNMAQGFRNSGSGIEDETVIEYRGGEVKRSKIEELQRDHFATQRFLGALTEQAAKQCEEKDVQYRPLTRMVPPIQGNDESRGDEVLTRKLMAERAEDEGIVISDGMLDDYLGLLAGNAEFSERDLKLINKTVNERTGLPRIRNHLRLELLAMQLQRYTFVGIPRTPIPTEAVELYARSNNRVECEVVPVSVSEYVSKVSGEPSAAEKKALFAAGKYDYAEADNKEPGFKKPREVNVQYFVAEMKTFLENEKARITDAEVEAEYNKLVEAEDPLVVVVTEEDGPSGFDLGGFGEDDDESAGDSDTNGDLPADSGEQDSPESTEQDGDSADTSSSETEEVPSKEIEKSEEKNEDGQDQSSHVVSHKRQQRVGLIQDDKQEEATEKTAEESSENTQKDSAEPKQEEEEVGGLADLQLSDEAAGPTDEDSKKVEFKPLKEVADAIRERLALQTATKKKDDAQKRAMVAMQNYQNKVLQWETEREMSNSNAPKPEAPDFEAMAKEYGLAFRETGVINRLGLMESEVGKVQVFRQIQTPQGIQPSLARVSDGIFAQYDRTELYDPQEVTDFLTRNGFIFWLAEKVDVRIPSIDEASPQIVEYWKYQQAIALATKDAEQMAAKAKSSGKKLTELYPETAAPTGEFTWFSPGGGAMAAYGRPFGIKNAGDEFMRKAFGLAEGESGVAANETRDTIYVIQRTTAKPSIVETGEEYLAKQYFRFKRLPPDVLGAAQVYAREIQFEMQDEFIEAMDIKRLK